MNKTMIVLMVFIAVFLGVALLMENPQQVVLPVENQAKQQYVSECMALEPEYEDAIDKAKLAKTCECMYEYIVSIGGDLQDNDLLIESAFKCAGVEY